MDIGNLSGYLELDSSKFDSGLDDAEGGLRDFAKSGAVIAAAAGAAIATGLAAAVVGGMNVEAANDKLAAQLGLTEGESARIGGVAGRLYADAYGANLGEVNDAVGAVISSISGMRDASDADIEAMSAKVLDLSTAFEVDVGRAAQVAGQMISSGLARDGSHAMDLLVASMQRVPAAVREDVLDAIDEYGPFMASIGLDGERAMGLLVASAEKGAFGLDKTGDALKEFTIRATDMSTASKVGYDALGMSQEEMTGKLLAGGDVAAGAFQEIVTGLQGIKDPAAQSQAALALFGTPLEDLSVQEIPAFLDSLTGAKDGLGDVAGAATAMGETLNTNASTNLESFKRQMMTAFIDIVGGQVLPMVSTFAAFLATNFGPALATIGTVLTGTVIPALSSFAAFLATNQTTFTVVAAIITAVFLPALVAMGVAALVSGAQTVAGWVMGQAAAIGALAVHSASVVAMVAGWVLMGAQALLGAAKIAAAWLIALGPIGLVIAAVVGLVALVVIHMDTIKDAIGAAWEWAKSATSTAWDAITGFFQRFWPAFLVIMTGGIALIPLLIVKNWDAIKAKTSEVWEAITGAIRAAWEAIKGAVTGAIESVRSGIQSAWDTVKSATNTAWDALKSAVSTAISTVVGYVTALPGRFISGLANLGSLLVGAAKSAWHLFNTTVGEGIRDAVAVVTGLPGKIVSGIGNLGSLLLSAGGDLVMGLIKGITGKVGAAVDAVKKTVGSIVSGAKGFLGIGSPSKVFAEIGEQTGQGLIVGLTRMGPPISAAMIDALAIPDPGSFAGLNVPTFSRGDSSLAGQATVRLDPDDRALLTAVARRPVQLVTERRVLAGEVNDYNDDRTRRGVSR